jgi:methyl-accepting chemotaxis protein
VLNRLLRRLSLRAKLVTLVGTLVVAITVFLGAFFPSRMESVSRTWAARRAVGIAEMLAGAVAPGVEFDDAGHVQESLDRLKASDGVLCARVRRADGRTLARWGTELTPGAPDLAPSPGVVFDRDWMRVVVPVRAKGGASGTVAIRFSLAELEREKRTNRMLIGLVALTVLVTGLAASFAIGTYVATPIRRMTAISQRIAQGDLSQPELDLAGHDEVGRMAEAFNGMLRSLHGLAGAADDVAAGRLYGKLDVTGHVAEAFNRMIRAQRDVVQQISGTSEQLAGAASALYGASREQAAAVALHSSGVDHVSRTMESLLEGAADITAQAEGVVQNAERTRETTNLTAQKLAELGGHTSRIGEILEIIRGIADRSDLLALNASIEGTRAGEAGRTFSLVAAEMRRLAESVTASVEDLKGLVADVRASSASTVMATEEGRRLAESTTESARAITRVTEEQRSHTEAVSRDMSDIAAVLTQSVSATTAARAQAEELKRHADRLAAIVGRFELSAA